VRPFSQIKSCLEVTDADIADALAPARSLIEPGPRERSLALVTHMASIATPGRGAPKILLLLAHMATRDWLDGDLHVKLIGDQEVSVLELFVDDGLSRVRLAGPLRIDAPLAEFAAGLRSHAHLVLPLVVEGKIEPRRIELRTSELTRRNSIPPSFSAVSPSLLPIVGGGQRPLPKIVSRIPPPDEPPPPELVPESVGDIAAVLGELASQEPSSPAHARPQFKPVSLPPALREALMPLKKK
jgi:hypothetical protein